MSQASDDRQGPFLLFEVGALGAEAEDGTGTFGLEVDNVFQVIEPGHLSNVPMAPAVVLGIMSHHGRIITVVDPAPILGLAPQGSPVAQIVILKLSKRGPVNLGIQVLKSHGIVPRAELEEVTVPGGPTVRWVAKRGKRLIHIIEADSLVERLGREFGTMDGSSADGRPSSYEIESGQGA